MGWIAGIFIYLIVWWMVFFCVLPWGNRPAENPEIGHATSAPANPRLGLKALATTMIAAVVFTIIWYIVDAGWVNFRVF